MYLNIPGRGRILSSEARSFKAEIKDLTLAQIALLDPPVLQNLSGSPLVVYIGLESPSWLCKDGSIRKKDAESFLKAINDSVFEALEIDDKMIFDLRVEKIISDQERILIEINTK